MTQAPICDELQQRIRELEQEVLGLRETVAQMSSREPSADRSSRTGSDCLLQASEQKYRRLFSTVTDAVLIHDVNTFDIFEVNDAACLMYGFSRDELLQMKVTDISAEPEKSAAAMTNLPRKAKEYVSLRYHRKKDGNDFPVEIVSSFFRLGRRELACGIVRDLTDKIQAEQALKTQKDFNAALIEHAPTFFMVIDPQGHVMMMSPAMLRELGYSADEVTGRDYVSDFVPENDKAKVEAVFLRLMSGLMYDISETFVMARDGRLRLVQWHGTSVADTKGQVQYFYSIGIDITEKRQTEQMLDRLISLSLDILCIVTVEGELLFVNPAFERILGYRKDKILFTSYFDIVHPDDLEATRETIRQLADGVPVADFENRNRCKSGDYLWLELKLATVPETGIVYAIARDVTQQKTAEDALIKSEATYRSLAGSLPGIVYRQLVRENNRMVFFNDMAQSLTGFSPEALCGGELCSIEPMIVDEDRQQVKDRIKSSIAEKRPFEVEYRIRHKTGVIRYFMERGRPVTGDDGALLHIDGVIFDVTDRILASEQLQFKNAILKTQQENSLDGILVMDHERKIISFNTRFVTMWGVPSQVVKTGSGGEDLLRVLMKQVANPDEFYRQVISLYEMHHMKSGEEIRMADGRILYRYSAPMFGPEDRYYGRVWYFTDITDRRRVEETLKEDERKYRAVVEDMPAMICRFLKDGTLTFVNQSYCRYFNKTERELIGCNFFRFIAEEGLKNVKTHLLALTPAQPMVTGEHEVIAADGSVRWQEWTDRALFDDDGILTEYQCIGRDITESKVALEERAKIEKQLMQAQKLQSIGTLAGGIAHDFNNILTGIMGYAELLDKFEIPEGSSMRPKIEGILKGACRARDLVSQILTFSRQSEQVRRPVQFSILVKESLKFLRATLPSSIQIHQEIQCHESMSMADPSQLYQIIMNLCTNAAHAMREKDGTLGVRLAGQVVSAGSPESEIGLEPGSYLVLTISDTGHGMSPAVIERIFDPYFTTKKAGEGTGLGLAVVHGIVKGYGGAITVESKLGKGSVFNIFLPELTGGMDSAFSEKSGSMSTGSECILIVDDEKIIVDVVKSLLEKLGYKVDGKYDSMEAAKAFREHPERYDFVITDMTMPHINGIDLARMIGGIRPDIPVVLCTGYSEDIQSGLLRQSGIREVIMKPVDIRQLSETIRRLLDDRAQV